MNATAVTDPRRADLHWAEVRRARAAELDKALEILKAELAVQKAAEKPSKCDECGVTHFHDWQAHLAVDALAGAIGRIRKVKAQLLKDGAR